MSAVSLLDLLGRIATRQSGTPFSYALTDELMECGSCLGRRLDWRAPPDNSSVWQSHGSILVNGPDISFSVTAFQVDRGHPVHLDENWDAYVSKTVCARHHTVFSGRKADR